ncbi:GNAT family N-acetyltransferase [Cytobacillus firmus]|uniref:GNAT family N-acetyltransferase n=1 Tax=Cytobacillus firmus TaxID=1399 RepID=UPI001C96EF90|nr:GNAT family N-acetyltransferase [Cytobacillus firmus]MBY6053317.1 GNAT family N-acetyltransferase [Cytobacillus firmus]
MSENKNTMKNMIIDWGLPDCIKENENYIVFKFDDKGLHNTKERGYHCEDGNVKFCLYNKKNEKVLFSMDFYKRNQRIMEELKRDKKEINLGLLYVHDESLRRKGIASYYIEKLKYYAIQEGVDQVSLRANANAINFKQDNKKNSLSQSELEKFYISRSSLEIPIVLFT